MNDLAKSGHHSCSFRHGGVSVKRHLPPRTRTASFFVTGGEHVMSNNMLIAVELNQRNAEVAEKEKEKKSRMEYHARREAALPIIDRLQNDLGDNIGQLKSKELEVLLRWKGVPMSTMGNVANRASSTNNSQRELRRR